MTHYWLTKSELQECSVDDALAAPEQYFDAKSKPAEPRWLLVDVQALQKTRLLNLPELRALPTLADMILLKKGNRLSIPPVSAAHWQVIEVADLRYCRFNAA